MLKVCPSNEKPHDAETALWESLQMDELADDMCSPAFAPNNSHIVGTGRTNNACEMCSNSLTTAGCGGC